MSGTVRNHVRVDCKCGRTGCMFCDGGLFACSVCGLIEGSLTTQCPGVESYRDHGDAVYEGREDFIGGKWVSGAVSDASPAKWRKDNATTT